MNGFETCMGQVQGEIRVVKHKISLLEENYVGVETTLKELEVVIGDMNEDVVGALGDIVENLAKLILVSGNPVLSLAERKAERDMASQGACTINSQRPIDIPGESILITFPTYQLSKVMVPIPLTPEKLPIGSENPAEAALMWTAKKKQWRSERSNNYLL